MNLTWFREHPYAAGAAVIVGGIFLFLLLKSRQSQVASGTQNFGVDPTLANLQAAQDVQQIQQNGATQIASINADVANRQTQAQLDAYKIQGDTSIQLAKVDADKAAAAEALTASIYKEMFDTARDEQVSNNAVTMHTVDQRFALAKSGVALAGKENRAKEGTNIVAAALGQGDVGSYNQATAAENIAHSAMISSIIKTAGSAATGLFGI